MGLGDMVDKAKEMLTGAKDDAAAKAGDAADTAKEKSGGMGGIKDKTDDLINKSGDKVDDMTGDKFTKHVDKGQDMAKGAIDKMTS